MVLQKLQKGLLCQLVSQNIELGEAWQGGG